MSVVQIVSAVLLLQGALVMLAAAVGVVQFPDFYTRLHAAGKGDTLGQGLILLGLALPVAVSLVGLKLGLIVLFIFVFNPTATHALARGAWVAGLQPWTKDDASAPTACPADAEDVDADAGALK